LLLKEKNDVPKEVASSGARMPEMPEFGTQSGKSTTESDNQSRKKLRKNYALRHSFYL
jgi:hypothetical protein